MNENKSVVRNITYSPTNSTLVQFKPNQSLVWLTTSTVLQKLKSTLHAPQKLLCKKIRISTYIEASIISIQY